MHSTTRQWLRDNALTLLDSAVDAIIAIDHTSTIQFVNRATLTLFGYEEAELVGSDLTMLMPEPYRSQHASYVNHYLTTGDARIIGIGRELTAIDRRGRVFPIYLAISEIVAGEARYFAGIVRDLTAQKAAETALMEQRDNLAHVGRLSIMGEMTASIAHEINQPLTAIAMYAQASLKLLEREEIDREKLRSALEKLNQQTLRAGAVIERIQRFVRNDGGAREQTDVNALLKELSHLIAGDARVHGLELTFDLAPGLPRVFCDPIQIQQVALNLIRNAIDSMTEIDNAHGHTIAITTRPFDGRVNVAISDRGIGVDADQAKQLFHAFHSTKADGMGMGLSISRSIIDTHGGHLDYYNNPDHGCTFHFSLPAGDSDD